MAPYIESRAPGLMTPLYMNNYLSNFQSNPKSKFFNLIHDIKFCNIIMYQFFYMILTNHNPEGPRETARGG
jgi:hypothetical protein